MKKMILIAAILMAGLSGRSQITFEKAYNILLENGDIVTDDKNQWVYGLKEILPRNYKINSFNRTIIAPESRSWFFFIDQDPYANWEHPALYAFVDSESGKIQTIKATTPPDFIQEMVVLKKFLETRERFLDFVKSNNIACGTATNKYAVIISGGWNTGNNHVRYWNDCSFAYKTLVNKYGYNDANIYTLMSDGTNTAVDISNGTNSNPDLDGDGDNDIQFSATKANITSVFNTLSGILDEDDELFIFTTDHGGVDSAGATAWDTLLYLWGETITDDEFALEVNKINAGKISIVMEQCNSGGFIDDLSGPNRVIATAARHDELSWAGPTINTDEFVYYWTSAMNEALPSGIAVNSDTNMDGVVTKREAFDYAEANDTRPETPQFNETLVNLGDQLTLNGTGDLYIKDNETPYHSVIDSGIEPNPFNGPMYTSRDIWVRQNIDGGTTHENPEYKTTSPNGVYVKIKNRGCAPIEDGKLRVYFSKASTGLSWPSNWINYYDYTGGGSYLLHGDEITSIPINIPLLNPGDETTIMIPWYPPNPDDFDYDQHHFCLLARVISQIDPVGIETTSVNSNTRNNNNIAWKNVSVYDTNPSNNITYTNVFIRNIFKKRKDVIGLYFLDGTYGANNQTHFLEKGIITATLDKELFERWKENGGKGRGIKIIYNTTIQITELEASLQNIILEPDETFSIQMQFKPYDQRPFSGAFTYDVLQKNEKNIIGGERFDIIYEKDRKQKEATLQKELPINFYPNPVLDHLVLELPISMNKTSVKMIIKDISGTTLINEQEKPLDIGSYKKQLNVSALKKGMYFLEIIINGKSIIKKLYKN